MIDQRIPRLILGLIVLASGLIAIGNSPLPLVTAQPRPIGMTAQITASGDIRIAMPERFALTFSREGITDWRDLRRDPAGVRNLVATSHALVSVSDAADQPVSALPALIKASPVRAQVRYMITSGMAVVYEVWAGGQIVITVTDGLARISGPNLVAMPSAGAALQIVARSATAQHWLLYLDAWTVDSLPKSALLPAQAGVTVADSVSLTAESAITIVPPQGIIRSPRLLVRNWPGGAPQVQRSGVTLTPGVDYLAEYDDASGDLLVQYLHLLPAGSDSERTFTIQPAQSASTLALELLDPNGVARPLDPVSGMLIVDADLPAAQSPAPGPLTTRDVFQIPYIQTDPVVRLRATVTDPPTGFSGARFQITGPGFTQTVDDTTPGDGLSAAITLPRRAEYTVTATILVDGMPGSISRSINPVGYGYVFVSIGDSITAGKWGFYRIPPESSLTGSRDGYPFTSPPAPESGYPRSADGRNYPQADNTAPDSAGYQNIYYAGYQIELNNQLTACLNSPVFILNDGFSGIRAARDLYGNTTGSDRIGTSGYLNALGKAAFYRQHIADLGAGQILLQVGTNDASAVSTTNPFNNLMPASVYKEDLRATINAIRLNQPDLALWVARLPWRNDGTVAQAETRRSTTQAFNLSIAELVNELGDTSPVFLGPDFYSYFAANPDQIIAIDPSNGSADNLHPTSAGFSAMATLWADVICNAIPREPDPSPTPTSTVFIPTVISTTSPTTTSVVNPTTTSAPSPTATHTASPTATSAPSPTATHTASPTATHTANPTATSAPSPTATHTANPTATHTPSPTATHTANPTATHTANPTTTSAPSPTATHTANPTATSAPPVTTVHIPVVLR